MALQLLETSIQCPYCWEPLEILVDPSDDGGSYVEDCQVCCRPILLQVALLGDDEVSVAARQEDGEDY